MAPSSRSVLRILGVTLLLALAAPGARAVAAADPGAFVAELGDDAVKAVQDQALSPAERVKRIGVLVRQDFDLPRIARFVLGRYWRDASEDERAEFTSLFSEYMVRMYSARVAAYTGQSFRILKQRVENETTTVVSTSLTQVSSGEPITVSWRVLKTPDGFKITDIDVGGVSMVLAQREEMVSVIQQNGGALSGLLHQLQQKTAELDLPAH